MTTCRDIDRALRGALVSEGKAVSLLAKGFEHVRDCPGCRVAYDRVMTLLRAEGGGAASAVELSINQARVLRALRGSSGVARKGPAVFSPAAVLAGLVLAAVAAAALLVVLPRENGGRGSGEEWRARAGASGGFSVRLLCETRDAEGGVRIQSVGDEGPNDTPSCPRGGTFVFAYMAARKGFVTAFVQRGDGPLVPAPGSGSDTVVKAGRKLAPLPVRIPSGSAARAVFALSRAPLAEADREAIFRGLESASGILALESRGLAVVVLELP